VAPKNCSVLGATAVSVTLDLRVSNSLVRYKLWVVKPKVFEDLPFGLLTRIE
jgi:hypothetical protein